MDSWARSHIYNGKGFILDYLTYIKKDIFKSSNFVQK